MHTILDEVRSELLQNADETVKRSGERFFKEKVSLYGVKSAVVGTIAKRAFKAIKECSKEAIFDLCEELWKSGMMEESFVACEWAYSVRKQFVEGDMERFERWIDAYVGNWASCDTFCNHTVGSLLEMYPGCIDRLKEWTKSPNRWMKRAAAVSLIVPARHGLFKEAIFEIADRLLLDKDDMVQKGYGWMLKSACAKYEEDVYRYVISKRAIMPRTALRYAIEKMPKEKKAEAMKK